MLDEIHVLGSAEVRTCPRCGAQVEVYAANCNCGFAWGSQRIPGSDQDISVPGEYRPVAGFADPRRASSWPWVLGILLIALGGWHIYCSKRLEMSIYQYIKARSVESPADGTIDIHVQPVTNLVDIKLTVVDKEAAAMNPSDRLMLDAALTYIRSALQPYVDQELSLVARKQVDPYAMALPYRIAFSLDIRSTN
jgi:hypothetical protein